MMSLHKLASSRRPLPIVQIANAMVAAAFAVLLLPSPARAALPEIRVAPLHYAEHLELGHPKFGFIDTSNPTGSKVHIKFEVQGFRQTNDKGELEFYDDERIASAVTPGVSEFDLGPREAVRTKFLIDPNKLGPGGTYGVIFARASSAANASNQINTSARLGTLLMLDVGGSGTKSGRIIGLNLPRLIFSTRPVPVEFTYRNTGQGSQALAFTPALQLSRGWPVARQNLSGPFVFPGRERKTQAKLTLGNRVGPLPVTLSDATGRAAPVTEWVLAVSGIWTWLLPLLILAALYLLMRRVRRRQPLFIEGRLNRRFTMATRLLFQRLVRALPKK